MSLILLLIIFVLILLIPTAYAGWIGAPYVPARLAAVNKAFDYVRLGEHDTFVDLGAGDGSIVLAAGRRGARARGYELSPVMWIIAWLRSLAISPLIRGVRRVRSTIVFGNFYKKSLADATHVYAFLMPRTMPRVRALLARQVLRQGKFFLAYAFPFEDVAPLYVVREKNCVPLYVYSLGDLTKPTR